LLNIKYIIYRSSGVFSRLNHTLPIISIYHTSVRKPRHHWLFARQLLGRAHMLDYLLR